MRIVNFLLVLAVAGCAAPPVGPMDLGACELGCRDVMEMEPPACLFEPAVKKHFERVYKPFFKITMDLKIGEDDCGCMLSRLDSEGAMSEVRIVYTNAPEIAEYIARNFLRYKPGVPVPAEMECLVGHDSPLWFGKGPRH